MRFAVLSDIHANLEAFDAVMADARENKQNRLAAWAACRASPGHPRQGPRRRQAAPFLDPHRSEREY